MFKMASKTYIFSLVLLLIISFNEGLRILVFFPMPSKSHSILGHGVVRNLLEAGHQVVHITSFPTEKPTPNLKEINVGSIGEKMRENRDATDSFKLKNLIGKGMQNIAGAVFIAYFSYDLHQQALEHPAVVEFFSDPREQVDAAVVEWFFSEIPAGIAPLFNCPLIWLGSTEAHWQLLRLIDEVPNPAYSVDLLSSHRAPLTLIERLTEAWVFLEKYVLVNLIQVPFEKLYYNSVYPAFAQKRGVAMPSYSDAVYNGSLLLLNSHPSIGAAYRLPQNAKYIAGYHIDTKVKPLPKDLQKIMDEAKRGVIYFSMGSNLKSADMSDEMIHSLLEMFRKLEQTVLWKFEIDMEKSSLPSNVHLLKWAPQQSIFSHPNLKLFITHGGQLSTTEAVHFGIPVVGIPVLGDQHVNMKSVVTKGFGICVTLSENLASSLGPAVRQVLANPSYKAQAEKISKWYHMRPRTPGEEMVHWIEYVVVTGGAPHLQSPALHVPCYQKLHLDVIAIFSVLVTLLFIFVRTIYKLCIRKKVEKSKKQ